MKTTLYATLAAIALSTAPALADHSGHGDHSGHSAHDDMTAEVSVGDLRLSGAYARATLPNAPVAGGFLTITNEGETDDRLLSASSDASTRVELHEMSMEDGVMKMRQLPDGLTIPAGGTVDLAPGGMHLMFMELMQSFDEGTSVEVTLMFEQAGVVTMTLPVGATNAKGADHFGHKE